MALAKTMEPLLQGNSAIRKMFELGQEMAEKYGKENVYDFSLGNSPLCRSGRRLKCLDALSSGRRG